MTSVMARHQTLGSVLTREKNRRKLVAHLRCGTAHAQWVMYQENNRPCVRSAYLQRIYYLRR